MEIVIACILGASISLYLAARQPQKIAIRVKRDQDK
jgi:hypothetical protein